MSKNLLSDPSFERLKKAFLRGGIQVERHQETVVVSRSHDETTASILLPSVFPLESKAVEQLLAFAAVHTPEQPGHVCRTCATPDFHPGSYAPVGSIVATTPDMVIPAAIGTDINCGMRLITTGLSLQQVIAEKPRLVEKLERAFLQQQRNVPVSAQAFKALFSDSPSQCIDELPKEGLWANTDRQRLQQELGVCISLSSFLSSPEYVPEGLLKSEHGFIRDPALGTVGSGNHFVELQVVDAIYDARIAYEQGLKVGDIVVMIHSGSRDVGFYVGRRWMDIARDQWPKGYKHPESGLYALTDKLALEYLKAMGAAARYAWLNRVVLAEMVRQCLQETFAMDRSRCVVDVPHNVVTVEHGFNVHRKGATPAHDGDLALIPGSMGDYSFLVSGLGHPDWLWSCSHGAGRSVRRQEVRARKPEAYSSEIQWECLTLKEERRLEEAPHAYKKIGPVIAVQEEAGLIGSAVRLRPWLTLKA